MEIGQLYKPDPVPDKANLGGEEYLKSAMPSIQFFINYGILPEPGGMNSQSHRWLRALDYYEQELKYRRYLALSEDEKKQYKAKPKKQKDLSPDAEW